MAISFVAAGAVIQTSNPVIPVPTGYAAGDLLILVLNNGIPPASITGWTLLTSYSAASPQFSIFYKIASASESSVSFTSASTTSANVMIAYRGTSGFDITGAFANTASGTSLATTSLTTTQANDYVISIYGTGVTSIGTWTAPASTTARVTQNNAASKRGLLIVDELKASAGATTARTGTTSLANQITSIGVSIKETAVSTNKGSFFFLM